MSDNLPVPLDGPLVHYNNPEEFSAALTATSRLSRLVAEHKEGNRYAQEANNEADDQFNYGQDWEVEPEVWDREVWDELSGGDEDLPALLGLSFPPDHDVA